VKFISLLFGGKNKPLFHNLSVFASRTYILGNLNIRKFGPGHHDAMTNDFGNFEYSNMRDGAPRCYDHCSFFFLANAMTIDLYY
jgi:hypothetical protein